jgi:hypothetical protein
VATSFTYYAAPHINSVSPGFGHVKSAKEQIVELKGSGFECFDADCLELKCRFGNTPDSYVYVQGTLVSAESVRCKVPHYTKPDVLNLELTINGESYTSDNQTFGFFDPFVLDAEPRLIAVDGSTKVSIQGIGFVDSREARALYRQHEGPAGGIACGGTAAECSQKAQFIDKRTLLAPTFPQSAVLYKATGKSVMWDPITIDATVIGDEYTQNDVQLYYYQDPIVTKPNIVEAPANLQAQLIVGADFGAQNKARLVQHATPKCRFTFGQKQAVTEASLLRYPFTAASDPNKINAFHCKTPQWTLDGLEPEQALLEVSLNGGQNYVGALSFTFVRPLRIHRDVPMSGPRNKATNVRAIGQGYRMNSTKASLKWGT